MSDFQFGRTGFGRNRQSHKIESDSISKFHSTIWHYQSNNLAAKKNENIIYRTLTKKTPLFSKFRELPSECWSIIFSYLRSSDKYYLMDEGSRNGTFVYEL